MSASTAEVKLQQAQQKPPGPSCLAVSVVIAGFLGLFAIGATNFATIALTNEIKLAVDKLDPNTEARPMASEPTMLQGNNMCHGKKADLPNKPCSLENGVINAIEQAGADVSAGFVGDINATGGQGVSHNGTALGRNPITEPYWKVGLCPVNVHWHLGAEHKSAGQYDDAGKGPADSHSHRKLMAGEVRQGLRCKHYDAKQPMYTKEYKWQHCVGMKVGETYEVHWPHSAAGACGTPYQYQTPFYDGVFCNGGIISLAPQNTWEKIGVQAQVFTIVNDENYYYPDLMRGMIVDGVRGQDIAKYTGSTTGTSRSNTVCSSYTPITWQVDRKCHLISASTFDKMCADMKAQADDMSDDLHAHGSREVVAKKYTANNLQ